jgi:hypothetical protein
MDFTNDHEPSSSEISRLNNADYKPSAFEINRLKNVEKRNELLAEVGLARDDVEDKIRKSMGSTYWTKQEEPKEAKKARKDRKKTDFSNSSNQATRASSRLSKQSPLETTGSTKEEKNDVGNECHINDCDGGNKIGPKKQRKKPTRFKMKSFVGYMETQKGNKHFQSFPEKASSLNL